MIKLTPAQKALLRSSAAGNGIPAASKPNATARSLIKRGLLTQTRHDETDRWNATDTGRALIGIEQAPPVSVFETTDVDVAPAASDYVTTPKPGGKIGTLIALLRSPVGATLPQMMAATGWQAHSVRGAMAGAIKKKLGLAIVSEKVGDTRAWRIVTQQS